MTTTGVFPITLCAILGIFDTCTTTGLALSCEPSAAEVVTGTTSQQLRAADRMFYWREEARELHGMAKHREREADLVLKKNPGTTTNEFVEQMRSLAHQLHAAAKFADAKAREAEQEMPYGTIH